MPRRSLVAALPVAALLVPLLAGSSASAAPPAPAPVAVVRSVGWTLPLPGPARVTRGFDAPAARYGAGHRGVDLAGSPGEQVVAAGAGTVLFAGMVAGRPVVSVAHAGGLRTTYEPVRPGVTAGQAVARGSPIGVLLAGHPGCPAAACLHWGLLRGSGPAEVYLDPMLLLDPPRIRLLPLG